MTTNLETLDYSKIKNYSEAKIKDIDLSNHDLKLKALLTNYIISNKRVAIINMPLKQPESIIPSLVFQKAYSLYPPIGSIYLSAAIQQNTNWDVELYDLQLSMLKRAGQNKDYDLESLIEEIDFDFDAYLFSCMFSNAQDLYKNIASLIRKRNKLIVFGGVYATGFCDTLLDEDIADIVIKYEGELQIVNLLNFWEEKKVLMRNTSFKYLNKNIHYPMLFEKIDPSNIVPQMKYLKDEIINYNTYGSLGVPAHAINKNKISATILGNRGCRAACTFCSVHNFMGPKVRTTNEDTTIETIKYLYEQCNVKHIDWLDDDLVAFPEKSKYLFKRIAELKYDLSFTTMNAMLAVDMDEDLVDAIGNVGFVQVGFGVESGDEEVRRKIRRVTRLENLKMVIQRLRKKFPHIFIVCNFMIGFPNETIAQIKKTVELAVSLGPDWCNLAVVQALPNTKLWDEFVEIDDPRIHTPNQYSPASATKEKGVSIDDLDFNIEDIYSFPDDKILNFKQVNDIWYPINTIINILNNYNFANHQNIWKLRKHLSVLSQRFPLDPTINLALSKCYKIEEGKKNKQMETKYKCLAEKEITDKKYWSKLFDYCRKFDNHNIIP